MKSLITIIILAAALTTAGTLEENRHYTWSIKDPNFPDGCVITSVKISLAGLEGSVKVFLIEKVPAGWLGFDGVLERGSYLGSDNEIDLASVVLPDSWAKGVFKFPHEFKLISESGEMETSIMNDALAEYNDYAGNRRGGGLLLIPQVKTKISNISVQITIRAFTGAYYKEVKTYTVEVPVDEVAIDNWAATEKLKLMKEFTTKLQNLEDRVALMKAGN